MFFLPLPAGTFLTTQSFPGHVIPTGQLAHICWASYSWHRVLPQQMWCWVEVRLAHANDIKVKMQVSVLYSWCKDRGATARRSHRNRDGLTREGLWGEVTFKVMWRRSGMPNEGHERGGETESGVGFVSVPQESHALLVISDSTD